MVYKKRDYWPICPHRQILTQTETRWDIPQNNMLPFVIRRASSKRENRGGMECSVITISLTLTCPTWFFLIHCQRGKLISSLSHLLNGIPLLNLTFFPLIYTININGKRVLFYDTRTAQNI